MRLLSLRSLALASVLCLPLAGSAQQVSARPAADVTLNVFAAASLTSVFTDIAKRFQAANSGISIHLNFAGSQQLLAQLQQGAPADVFASAAQTQMTQAQSAGLIAGSPAIFARNRLTAIVPTSNSGHVYNLADLGRPGLKVVLGVPTVPIGQYARVALGRMSSDAAFGTDFSARVLKNVVSNELNVKDVVTKVALGAADAGIVYVTDATGVNGIATIDIPDPFNVLASYPIAVTKKSANAAQARAFMQFVLGSTGVASLQHAGFILPGATATSGGPSTSFTLGGQVKTSTTYSVADLQKLSAQHVTATIVTRQGRQGSHDFTGVYLSTLLNSAGLILNADNKNDQLQKYVVARGTDGYQVVFSEAELDPDYANSQVLVAYAEDGAPLSSTDGGLELVVPHDHLASRYVHNLTSVTVVTNLATQ